MISERVMFFLWGAITAESLIVAFFFMRFWKKTHDRFFALFALAFALFGFERLPLFFIGYGDEAHQVAVYLIRLCAFCMIIAAILQKNRATKR